MFQKRNLLVLYGLSVYHKRKLSKNTVSVLKNSGNSVKERERESERVSERDEITFVQNAKAISARQCTKLYNRVYIHMMRICTCRCVDHVSREKTK